MSDSNQIRINELARELEIKAKVLIDYLPEIGVKEKKTHSSSIEVEHAVLVRKHFQHLPQQEAAAEAAKSAAAKAKPARPRTCARCGSAGGCSCETRCASARSRSSCCRDTPAVPARTAAAPADCASGCFWPSPQFPLRPAAAPPAPPAAATHPAHPQDRAVAPAAAPSAPVAHLRGATAGSGCVLHFRPRLPALQAHRARPDRLALRQRAKDIRRVRASRLQASLAPVRHRACVPALRPDRSDRRSTASRRVLHRDFRNVRAEDASEAQAPIGEPEARSHRRRRNSQSGTRKTALCAQAARDARPAADRKTIRRRRKKASSGAGTRRRGSRAHRARRTRRAGAARAARNHGYRRHHGSRAGRKA